jgi:hypothetical protein
MAARIHTGLIAALSLPLAGLTALALPISAGAANGQVCMGVVIDDSSGASPAVQTANVTPGTTSDLQAMSTAGDTVTQNNSGLVCAINDYPADGLDTCLSAKKGQYFYWSYWQGNPDTNTWTYASVGPASHDVSAGQDYVEGWRYQNPGPDNPTAPPPAVSPAVAFAGCQSTSTTTTTSGGGAGSPGGGGSTPSTTPTTASITQPTTAPSSGTVPTHPAGGAHAATTTSSPKALAGSTSSSVPGSTSSTTSTTAAGTGAHAKNGTSPTKLAEADTASRGQSGGDPVLPIVIVALVIMLLGGVAWFRWRRRPAEE